MDNVTTELFEVIMDVKGDEDAEKALGSLTKLMKLLKVELNSDDSEYLRKISKEVAEANKQFGKLMSTAKKTSSYLSSIGRMNFSNIAGIKNMNLSSLGLNEANFLDQQVEIKVDLKTADATQKLESYAKLLLNRGQITEDKYNKMMNNIANSAVAMKKRVTQALSFEEPMRALSSQISKVKSEFATSTGLMANGFDEIKTAMRSFTLEDNFKTIKKSMLEFIRLQEKAGNGKFTKYRDELKKLKFDIESVNKSIQSQENEKYQQEALAQRVNYYNKVKKAEEKALLDGERAMNAIGTKSLQTLRTIQKQKLAEQKKYQSDLATVSKLNINENSEIKTIVDNASIKAGVEQLNKYKASLTSVNEKMFEAGEIGGAKFWKIKNSIDSLNSSLVETSIKSKNINNAINQISSSPLSRVMQSTKLFGVELNKTKVAIDKINLANKLKAERAEMLKNIAILKKYGKISNLRYKIMRYDINKAKISLSAFGKTSAGVMTKLGELSSTTRAIFVNLTRAFIAVQIGKSVIDWTEKVEKLNNAVFQLQQFHGYEDIEGQLNRLDSVTGGVLNKYSIISATNKAIDLGVDLTNGKLLKLARMVTIVAQKYGTDATKMYEDFTVALGKANPIVLDNIGIILKKEQAYTDYFETMYEGTKTYNEWLKSLKQTRKNSIYMEQAMKSLEEKTKGFVVAANESQSVMAQIGSAWNELSLKLANTGAITTILKLFKAFVSVVDYTITSLDNLNKAYVYYNNLLSYDKKLTGTIDDKYILADSIRDLTKRQKELNEEIKNYKGLKTKEDVIRLQDNINYLRKLKSALEDVDGGNVQKAYDVLNELTKNTPKDLKFKLSLEGKPSDAIKEVDKAIQGLYYKYSNDGKGNIIFPVELSFSNSLIKFKELTDELDKVQKGIVGLQSDEAKHKVFLAEDAREYNKIGKELQDYLKYLKEVEGISINKNQSKRLDMLSKEFDVYSAVNHMAETASMGIAKYRTIYNKDIETKDKEILSDISKGVDKVSKSIFGYTVNEIANKKVLFESKQVDKDKAEGLKKIFDFYQKSGNYIKDYTDGTKESIVAVKDVTQGFNDLDDVSKRLSNREFSSDKVQEYFNNLVIAGKTSKSQLQSTFTSLAPILKKNLGELIPSKQISNSLEILRAEAGLTIEQLSKVVKSVLEANDQAPKLGIKWINIIDLVRAKLLEVQKDTDGTNKKLKDMVLDWYSIVKKAYSLQLNPADKLYEQARFEYENNLKTIDEYIKKTQEAKKGFMSEAEYQKARDLFKLAYEEKIKLLKLKDLSAEDLTIKFNIELDNIENENLIDKLDDEISNSLNNISDYGLESSNVMRYLSQSLKELGATDFNFEANFTSLRMFNNEMGTTYKDVSKVFKAVEKLKTGTKKIYDIKLEKNIKSINDKYKEQAQTVKDNVISITKMYNKNRTTLGLDADLTKALAKKKTALDKQLIAINKARDSEIDIAKNKSYLEYIKEITKAIQKLFTKGKELNLDRALESLKEYEKLRDGTFTNKTNQLAQDEVNSWQIFNSNMWSYAEIYKRGAERFKSVGETMISELRVLNNEKDNIIFNGSEFSLLDGWAKGLTPEKIEYIKEALKSINSTAKTEMDNFVDQLKESSDQIGEAISAIGKDIASMLANFAGEQLFSMITDTSRMDLADKLSADMAELNKAKESGLIDQQEYNNKAIALQEAHDLKLKQMNQQAKRDALIQLGSLFFNKGLGYLIEAPAIAFGGTNGLGNPVAAEIYAGTGLGLMALGGALGAYGASIKVPQEASSVNSTKRVSSEGTKDINIYLYNESYSDRRDMDRNMSRVKSRNSSINYGG